MRIPQPNQFLSIALTIPQDPTRIPDALHSTAFDAIDDEFRFESDFDNG